MFLSEALKVVELLFTPRYCKAGNNKGNPKGSRIAFL